MAHTSSTLNQRYNIKKRSISPAAQRAGIIGALAVALATAIWFTVDMAFGQLEYKDVGYTISSDTRASVDFEVTKDFEDTAECMLHVLDDSYAVVGSRIVTIGPHEGSSSADRSQYYTANLLTEYRGVSGVVDSCWLVDD